MANKILYRTGATLFFFGVVAAILYHSGIFVPTEFLYPCAFRRLSGLYCPGCGGTRSVEALLRGDFLSCFFYHPFVFYCFGLYVLFMVSHSCQRIHFLLKSIHGANKKKSHQPRFQVKGLCFRLSYVYIGIIILLLQWMIKNLTLL